MDWRWLLLDVVIGAALYIGFLIYRRNRPSSRNDDYWEKPEEMVDEVDEWLYYGKGAPPESSLPAETPDSSSGEVR